MLSNLLFEDLHALHEIGIELAQADILFLEEPPRQTAHLPLCTDIGSGAHNDIHAMFLCQSAERCDIIVTSEIELSLTLFVNVPEHIDTEGVHAQGLTELDAMFPIRARDAGVMHLSSLHDKRLAVEQEGFVAHREITGTHTHRH